MKATQRSEGLALRGDYVNLLYIASRSNPDDEIQSIIPELISISLAYYADNWEKKANGDMQILERVAVARQASLRLCD